MSVIDPQATSIDDSAHHFVFDVTGMHCAACSSRVERVLNAKPGVSAQVNLALERADVTVSGEFDVDDIQTMIEKTGFGAKARQGSLIERQEQAEQLEEDRQKEEKNSFSMLVFSALLTLPLVAPMFVAWAGLDWHLAPYVQLGLASPVQFIAGARFYRGAVKALSSGAANMDVLVALGTSAAYLFSLYQVITLGDGARGHLYFEASAAILTLVQFGKWLEGRARRGAADALRALMALRPQMARLVAAEGGADRLVPIEAVSVGDAVRVLPGETVPVDGVLIEGKSEFDEALLSGESIPVLRSEGDKVVTGSVNGVGSVVLQAVALGDDTVLARIIRLVDEAQLGKAKLQSLADRIAAIFVPVVIGLSILTFAGWLMVGSDMETSLISAVAVLVIACPCALGLATPTALVAGTGAAAQHGILIRDIDVLEQAGKVKEVIFDKTGTLTQGQPGLVRYEILGQADKDRLLAMIAAVQQASEHPLAKASVAAAKEIGLVLPKAGSVSAHVGQGLEGVVDGQKLVIGKPDFLENQGIDISPHHALFSEFSEQGLTLSAVSLDGAVVAVLGFRDEVRPEAMKAIAGLKARGLRTSLLSGDNPKTVELVQAELGLDEALGSISPQGKIDHLIKRQEAGQLVAMVGDGLNDAPALAQADLGIAMGSGSDVAIGAAAITLMRPDPGLVQAALDIAHRTHRKIGQNLFWAFIYNVIGIPLAAFGFLSPALAGAAMAFSSVSVVSNALLLRRWRP